MRKTGFKLFVLFYLLSLILSPVGVLAQGIAPNTTCPVMPGERVKQKFYVDYQGVRVYLCCRNCAIKFKNQPEKYIKNLKQN